MIDISGLKEIGFGTVEIIVPAKAVESTKRILLTDDNPKKHQTKVFYTDGWRECKESHWVRIIKVHGSGRRIVWQCSCCGYKSRARSRFCGGCGNHMEVKKVGKKVRKR